MFKITIHTANGEVLLDLTTVNRHAARYAYILCQENDLECKVVKEQVPLVIKFKDV